jgi:hypothetical protein
MAVSYMFLLDVLLFADSVLEDRYEGHPQLQKLIHLKDKQVSVATAPPQQAAAIVDCVTVFVICGHSGAARPR